MNFFIATTTKKRCQLLVLYLKLFMQGFNHLTLLLREANRVVLDDLLTTDIKGKVDSQGQILGRVEVRQGAEVENSTLYGPLSIAEGCQIRNSVLGPYTSIGKETIVEAPCVEHSVILENCHIHGIDWFEDSVIGRGTGLTKSNRKRDAVRLFIGDDAKVEF